MRLATLLLVTLFLTHPARADYDATLAHVDAKRIALADRYAKSRTARERAAILTEARHELQRALVDEVIPPWLGTKWQFYGTTESPGTGAIACGYFVSTVLRDTGLRVERVRLAQQASENIIKTLVPAARIQRFHNRPVSEVISAVKAQGEGAYLVGLDFHVGLLVNEGGDVKFCHSSYLGPATVTCEPASTSPALPSRYTVLAPLLVDEVVQGWLEGHAFPTRRS